MSAEIDFTFAANKGDAWKNNNHPQIQVTISSDGHVGIWANDGGDRLVVCWCDVSVRELKAIVATCELMGINQ